MSLNLSAKYFTIVISIIFFLHSCSDEGQGEIVLVDKGNSDFVILIDNNKNGSLSKSAEILQDYVQKISHTKIEIIDADSTNKNRKSILIKTDNRLEVHELSITSESEGLIISGGSDQATRNAVWVFLEEYLKCKWYAPGVEEIPKNDKIELPNKIDYHYTPEVQTRTVHSRLFYENPLFAEKHKVTTRAFPYYVPSARVHTFHKFLPEEKFYSSNPEYYALRDGKRLPTQLCLSNPEVYRIVKDSVQSLFNQNPDANVLSVSQDDNQQYCTCNNCAKIDESEGGPTGSMIQFVNKIAKEFPDKTISTLAYQYTRKPSKTPPLDNVLITLCSIECDRSAPIEEKCQDFADDLRGWKKITDNIRIWDYTTQFTNFLAPFPNIHTLKPNIEFFAENNAKWIFEQHSNNPSELFELRSYLMAKLLWNPSVDVNILIQEFTDGYYKDAGSYIQEYIELIHNELKSYPDFFLFLYGDPSQAFSSYLRPDLLTTYDKVFDSAENAVADKPEILKRVREARLSIDYTILEAAKKGLSEEYSIVVEEDLDDKKINPKVLMRLDRFYETCKKSNITLMNEMGFTVDDYYNNYKEILKVATKPNKALGKQVNLLTNPKKYANEDPQTLTDGSLGGNGFYANWLGFEGNNLEAIIDLSTEQTVSSISMAYLQVTNHIVFFPTEVQYYAGSSSDDFQLLGTVVNDRPLNKKSKVNDIKYFDLKFPETKARFIKIVAVNMNEAPYWHHAAGLPTWVFSDEIIID